MQTTPTTSVYQRRFRNDWSNFPRYPIVFALFLPFTFLSSLSLSLPFLFFAFPLSLPLFLESENGTNGENVTRGRGEITNVSRTCYFFRGKKEEDPGVVGRGIEPQS